MNSRTMSFEYDSYDESFADKNDLFDYILDHKDEILSDFKIDDLSGDGGLIELWSPDDQTADLFKDFDMDIPQIDNLPGCDPLVDFGGLLDDIVNAKSTTSAVPNYRQCISDHQYSRSPIDCSSTEQDSSNSPTYFYTNNEGVASDASPPYLCTSEESVNSGSPLTDSTSTTMEEETESPDSRRMNQPWSDYDERSPLGNGLEDVNVNNFVQDLLCGIDDGSGLVTVDMNPNGNQSTSDDEDDTSEVYERSRHTSSHSLFDFSPFSKQSSKNSDALPFTINDLGVKTLCLSDEEMKLLAQEGVTLPTDMPLTKEEERALKAVRRKIRNKVSAKTSRKRKQEYVDGLEKRVKHCSVQNRTLMERVDRLEKQNGTLINQLKKLKSLITPNVVMANGSVSSYGINNMSTGTRIGTGTCIMVLILSFGLFVIPSLDPLFGGSKDMALFGKNVGRGKSRNLLDESIVINGPLDHAPRDGRGGGRDQYITANPSPPYPFKLASPDEAMTLKPLGGQSPYDTEDDVTMETDEFTENYNKSVDGIDATTDIIGPLPPQVFVRQVEGGGGEGQDYDILPQHEINEGIMGTNSNFKNDL